MQKLNSIHLTPFHFLMKLTSVKSITLQNAIVRFLLLSVLILTIRFAYVITTRGQSCHVSDDFCFFRSTSPGNQHLVTAADEHLRSSSAVTLHPTSAALPELNFSNRVLFYTAVFHDLISDGFLSTKSKSLCIAGDDVYALRELNVVDSIGTIKKPIKPLVITGLTHRHPFDDNTFDFIFSGDNAIDRSEIPAELASEIVRTVKPEGYVVVHTASIDSYSFNSLIRLFNNCTVLLSRRIESNTAHVHQIIMKKQIEKFREKTDANLMNECSVAGYKQELLKKSEPLIETEPMKPWIALKRNMENVKYLPEMVDIGFRRRYVYVDVGSRSYGSSIVSWFKKRYPKQNKTFDIYAIEADRRFHDEYKSKKGVTLLPYAAWVKNESLVFEINRTPGGDGFVNPQVMGQVRPVDPRSGIAGRTNNLENKRGMSQIRPVNLESGIVGRALGPEGYGKQRGMGRIRPMTPGTGNVGSSDVIQGFDFAVWLKDTVSEKDFVVMKMDVEGAEFDLIPRLIETGAICLIDELLLECHYNRWQKCCPGVRSRKYEKTYEQCLDLFRSLRQQGVLVHQWW